MNEIRDILSREESGMDDATVIEAFFDPTFPPARRERAGGRLS